MALLLLAACTGADFGESDDAQSALVHVDVEARRAGAVTFVDGRPWTDPGPVALDPGTAIVVRVPSQTAGATHENLILRVAGGELVDVTGANVVVARSALLREVATDALVVATDEETALAVARALGDDVTVTLHSPHGYQLDGPDVVGRAGRSNALRAVTDVRFVRAEVRTEGADAGAPSALAGWETAGGVGALDLGSGDGLVRRVAVAPLDGCGAREPQGYGSPTAAAIAPDGVALDVLEAADLVGHYRAGDRVLVLDAEGGYVLSGGSSDRARGRWRLVAGRVELEPLGHATSLHLSPNDDGSLEIAGLSPFVPSLGVP